MTGEDFKALRLRLGLSLRGMAVALGMKPGSARHLRTYEVAGPPPRIAARAAELTKAPTALARPERVTATMC